MNVILLSNFCNRRGRIDICVPGAAAWMLAVTLMVGGGLVWTGYTLGVRSGAEEVDLLAVHNMESALQQERLLIEAARDETQANLDALAVHMGSIRAHLLRLDALGERLVGVGKLDEAEFDFRTEPAQGGADWPEEGNSQTVGDLAEELDRLNFLLDDREHKLLMLEDLLTGRQLLDEVTLSGRPVRKGWVSSTYGKRTDPFSGKKKHHRGIDFAGKRGVDIIAVAAGVVIKSESTAGYGNIVELKHTGGYTTRYAHNEKNLVQEGDLVEKGQTIALLGSTGRSNGPHVHFEVKKDGREIDPKKFVYAK